MMPSVHHELLLPTRILPNPWKERLLTESTVTILLRSSRKRPAQGWLLMCAIPRYHCRQSLWPRLSSLLDTHPAEPAQLVNGYSKIQNRISRPPDLNRLKHVHTNPRCKNLQIWTKLFCPDHTHMPFLRWTVPACLSQVKLSTTYMAPPMPSIPNIHTASTLATHGKSIWTNSCSQY